MLHAPGRSAGGSPTGHLTATTLVEHASLLTFHEVALRQGPPTDCPTSVHKTSVYLSAEEIGRLATLAERAATSQAEVIRRAVMRYEPPRHGDRSFSLVGCAEGPGGSVADLAASRFSVACLDADDQRVVADLERRYDDLDVGLADLSLVIVAKRWGTRRIRTFDERHFRAVHPLDGGQFLVLPSAVPAR